MADFEHENRNEEDRCLDQVRSIIKERRETKRDVGAIIIEPITSYNNAMATPYYYRKLRQIASENEIPFIVDETRTGLGSSGKMWAHEHWNLAQGADLVSFGGKTGISGFYSTVDFKLNDLVVSFDQPVDMIKLLNYGVVWQTIQKKNLLSLV